MKHYNKKEKILFVLKTRMTSYGVSLGLINSAQFVCRKLNALGYPAKVVTVTDSNEIDRVVTKENPKHVILEALYVTPAKVRELLSLQRHKDRVWNVRLHSRISFLSGEGIAIGWLNEYKKITKEHKNFKISANNSQTVDDLEKVLGFSISYLPNIHTKEGYRIPKHRQPKPSTKHIDIACFGSIRPLKNQLIQAFAAIKFADSLGKKLRFHINAGRVEGGADPVLRNIRALLEGQNKHQLIQWDWMPHDEFMRAVNFMDLGLQVSFDESFNLVTSDFVLHKIPIIVSDEIDWMPSIYRSSPTDTEEIVSKLKFAWKFPLLAAMLNSRALDSYNNKSIKEWIKYLK